MSRGQWERCPHTGIPINRLARVSDQFLTNEGFFNRGRFPDCNIFSVNSISVACGFGDVKHFVAEVLTHPNCPIHVRRLELVDENTGQVVAEVVATHQNSAEFGGQMWREMKIAAARQRAVESSTT